MPRLVAVRAVDDDVAEGTHYGLIGVDVVSFDVDYQHLQPSPVRIEIKVSKRAHSSSILGWRMITRLATLARAY